MHNGEVKASILIKHCGVPYQTFQTWVRDGWFGDDKKNVGSGSERSYTFEEALCARLLAELSPFGVTKSKKFKGDLSGTLETVLHGPLILGGGGKKIPGWMTLWWTGEEYWLTTMYVNLNELPNPARIRSKAGRWKAYISIPFGEIYQEVSKLFEGAEE